MSLIVPLVDATDPILRQPTQAVQFNEELATLGRQLLSSVVAHGGLGLAAPQIGISQSAFVVLTSVGTLLVFNPRLKLGTEFVTRNEGCLSLPGVTVAVPRATSVQLSAFNLNGQPWAVTLKDLDARIVQHEYDHLKGKLITDYE